MIDDTTPSPVTMGGGDACEALVSGLEERGLASEDAALAVAVVLESVIGAIKSFVLDASLQGHDARAAVVLGASLVDDLDSWYDGFKPEPATAE